MKAQFKILSVILAVMMLASGIVLAADASCLHNTEKRLVENEDGFAIANVCTLCGVTVSEMGYVDDSESIPLYKESAKTNTYTDTELATGFGTVNGNALYVGNSVVSSAGVPYWFTFDLKVNGLPAINEGDGQADLTNTDSRAYKGWSLICIVNNNSYDAPLRLIADGWEEGSGAVGSQKGNVDGYAPIQFSNGSSAYRFNVTVVKIKAGDELSFALRIDPTSGRYDAYVNGGYAGTGLLPAKLTENNPFIRLGEYDTVARGGLFDVKNVKMFKDNYTIVVHNHSFESVIEFFDEGLMAYETCACGVRNAVESKQITSVVADGLPHVLDGMETLDIGADSYVFVTDINLRGEVDDGNLIAFGDEVVLEIKDEKLVSGETSVGVVKYPTTYQAAIEISDGDYKIYVNGRYAKSGKLSSPETVILGDESFDYHVRFMYNKAVTLGETTEAVIPGYTEDKSAKLCYHDDGDISATAKTLAHTESGVRYIYNCTLCGERVYSMLKKDLTNPANDTAYKYAAYALMKAELDSFDSEKPRYLYLQNNVIGKTAAPYWVTFDVTPSTLPSNATGDLNDPNTRAYKGYGLFSTEASFMPATELRVIPDGWESGNASGKTKGVTDGKCEVHIIAPLEGFDATTEAKVDSFNYRRSETVAYLEVGKTTHFALRIDPKSGNYDVYVDGVYKASSDKPAMPDMSPKMIFHDNGMGNFNYSNISVCEEATSFEDKVVSFEADVIFAPDVSSSENAYTALLAIERNREKYNLFYANNKSGLLSFKDGNGNLNTLYDDKGSEVYLDTSKKITVIYDDINGDLRYYVGGKLAQYNDGEKLVWANGIKAYDADFVNADGGDYSLCFDRASITSISVSGLGKTDTAEIVGFQPNDVDNSIRLVSGVDSLYYGAVGYEVQAFKANGEAYSDASAIKDSDKVYSSVIADGITIPATKYGYNYFSALKIEGDFLGYKDSYIIVKPFTVVGSEKYYGEEVKLNILDNGRYEFAKEN